MTGGEMGVEDYIFSNSKIYLPKLQNIFVKTYKTYSGQRQTIMSRWRVKRGNYCGRVKWVVFLVNFTYNFLKSSVGNLYLGTPHFKWSLAQYYSV